MKSDAPDQDLVDTLNAIALDKEELFKVINDVRLAHELGECFMMTGWIAKRRLFEALPHKAEAILTRLQALSEMMETDELKRWILSAGFSLMPVAHRALVSAAADHPLSIINGDITFEKESFLIRILELAESEGICS